MEFACQVKGRGMEEEILPMVLPEPAKHQGAGLQKGGSLSVAIKFMIMSQRKVSGHIEVETRRIH
jgi:hypothetical protein